MSNDVNIKIDIHKPSIHTKNIKQYFHRTLIVYPEFEVFATSQEDCRKKWLTTEERCSSALKELNEARANKEKLELQVRHVTELLKNEILIRQRLQKEEKDLVSIRIAFYYC